MSNILYLLPNSKICFCLGFLTVVSMNQGFNLTNSKNCGSVNSGDVNILKYKGLEGHQRPKMLGKSDVYICRSFIILKP